jgi:DNA-directed RNA polymerase subunit RPC12/RpoP
MRKNFIHKNEEFECENCGHLNPLGSQIRNHCSECLFSKHLDKDVPGDRASECGGLMRPNSITYSGSKGFMINFICLRCSHEYVNKVLEGDNQELVSKISSYGHQS